MLERMQVAIQAHNFEREMLEHCKGNNMDRIVVAIDFGDTIIKGDEGREPIFYLMFELAESDVRVRVDRRTKFDYIWTLGALHDLAVAIQQLHKGNVSHNDIKPENFLVFKDLALAERLQKLADLGCATSPLMASIYDDALCAGDPRYAAPEALYGQKTDATLRSFDARRAMDIYHLGSMIFFLITGRMLTPEIVQRLTPEQRPPAENDDWSGTLADVIPYWREAFARVLEDFVEMLPKDDSGKLTRLGSALLAALVELTEPDPQLRGHPHNRNPNNDRLSVQQYVSLFNGLRRFVLH
jgi:serine/threonine protein kinase